MIEPWVLALSIVLSLVMGIAVGLAVRRGSPARSELARRRADPGGRDTVALTRDLLDHVDHGVVVLNHALTPMAMNATSRAMLGLGDGPVPARLQSDALLSVARAALTDGVIAEAEVPIGTQGTIVNARALTLDRHDAVALFLVDTTRESRLQRIRRQFVVNASHELKTPVTSVLTLSDALQHALDEDPGSARQFAGQIATAAERLSDLIQDLLDLSRVEDPASIARDRVDLGEVARREMTSLADFAEAKAVEVTGDLHDAVVVHGDTRQLGLMIKNLVDNAIRYSSSGGHVAVSVAREDGTAVVRVTDDGIGIPLRAHARVFERFYRVDKDRARDTGGTGLGLSIVKHVAELHGGHVELQSEIGEGSTFTVHLPTAPTS